MKYNVIKSDKDKYVYFTSPRVGSKRVEQLLREYTTPDIAPKTPWNGDLPILFSDISYDSAWDDYFKFIFIKNPWDRLASFYRSEVLPCVNNSDVTPYMRHVFNMMPSYGTSGNKIRKSLADYKSFHTFVEDIALQEPTSVNTHYRRQLYLFPNDKMDYIGRFEDFKFDVQNVINIARDIEETVPIVQGPNPSTAYVDLYSNKTAGMVYDLYKDDIETFGYSFGY